MASPSNVQALPALTKRGSRDSSSALSSRVCLIGSGSEALVHSVTKNGVKFAVKSLRKELVDIIEQRQRFDREVNLLASLSHPNVVSLHSRVERFSFSMDFLDDDLSNVLLKHERLPLPLLSKSRTRAEMMAQLASALAYLHSGINDCVVIHRDIKPENVGVTFCGRNRVVVKLMDFGLAVAMPKETKTNKAYRLTGATGSVRYMAPECASYEYYGTPADVFSFSLVCWEVLALRGRPFGDLDVRTHMKRVVKGTERPSIPIEWARQVKLVVTSAWNHDPLKRPTSSQIESTLKLIVESDDDADLLATSSHSSTRAGRTLSSVTRAVFARTSKLFNMSPRPPPSTNTATSTSSWHPKTRRQNQAPSLQIRRRGTK